MTNRNRDEFKETTKRQIAKRAGYLCSFPNCRKPTVGAALGDDERDINIGTAAHICAAAPGGPRYDESMSREERKAAKNGTWMCRDHGTAVDSVDSEFTVEQLREWKDQAEMEARLRVLRSEMAPSPVSIANAQLVAQFKIAAAADLEVFRRTTKWPATSVALTLEVDGFDEAVSTSILANVVTSLDDLILVAQPGMGKTTSLFQIAESVLANDNCIPILVPLGDWATDGATLIESILRRPAFHGLTEEDFCQAAAERSVVVLLDGWNELDADARQRARVQVTNLKAQLPELSLAISTRRQALDIPFGGTRVDLLPLNEQQQMLIAEAMRGDAGKGIVDQAWRTAGVRELVTIPLYLATLLSLPEDAPFPTTKEEVLRHFVDAHEKEASRAEALQTTAQGFQQDYLEGLAVFATRTANTTISDSDARSLISETETYLAENGQISIKPQPNDVLEVLVGNHLIIRTGDAPGFSFQHQQFQEWFASHFVERRIVTESADLESVKAEIFDLPSWEEAILFAVEHMARGDRDQRVACGNAILAAFHVDPILSAEMIHRSTDEIWAQIAATIQGLVARWHVPETADRALRFMLTSGRPEFLDAIWPLITHDNDQISLEALRNCSGFRVSILGIEAEQKIKTLPSGPREVLLHEMAMHSDMDGLNLASTIAMHDTDPEVQASTVDAMAFRRADRHVAVVLQNASEETFDLVARKSLVDDVDSEQVKNGVRAARERQAAAELTALDRLRMIVFAKGSHDRSAELTALISTMEIGQGIGELIYQARNRYSSAVADGLLARVRAGSTLFYGADDMLADAGFILEDDSLLQLAQADPVRDDDRAEAAASVLGPLAAGYLVESFLEAGSHLRVDGKYDSDASKLYLGLQARIAHLPGASLVAAVLAHSEKADNVQMEDLVELLSCHPVGETDRARPFDIDSIATIHGLVEGWGTRMLASGNAERRQLANIARLASKYPSASLLPILKRLLDENLQRYRAFYEEAKATGWRQSPAKDEVTHPYTYEYQLAFSALNSPEATAMMQEYLVDEHFGELASRVVIDYWVAKNEQPRDNLYFGGVDFSAVIENRQVRSTNPNRTCEEAEMIFAAIDQLIADGATVEQKQLAVSLGIAVARIPHGQRDSTIRQLIALAPRRVRSSLVLNLILSGEQLDIGVVADGISETLEEAKTKPWILTQSNAYEVRVWLRLLPFLNPPAEALATVLNLAPALRGPRILDELIRVYSFVPSDEAEEFLFRLAEEDSQFYLDHSWRTTVLRLGTPTAVRRIIDLLVAGAFDDKLIERWTFTSEIGALINESPELRAYVYGLLENCQSTSGFAALACGVAACPDEEGLLLLLKVGQQLGRSFIGWQTIKGVVTEQVSSEDWEGAYEVVPVPVVELRRKLLELTTDGSTADAAACLLTTIDKIRDEYGAPATEPRHPNLKSGKSWPLLSS